MRTWYRAGRYPAAIRKTQSGSASWMLPRLFDGPQHVGIFLDAAAVDRHDAGANFLEHERAGALAQQRAEQLRGVKQQHHFLAEFQDFRLLLRYFNVGDFVAVAVEDVHQ